MFGLVVRPIQANSAEWNSKKGQDAIWTEMSEHDKRGTWLTKEVVELDDLMAEVRSTGEEVILGGVHPILGAKGSERSPDDADLRCRVVFTAPRARTSSGLDIQCLYDEISASPITFQGSRAIRAYAALRGFKISSRDAKSAYLQSKLRRPGTTDPRTFVALPKQFWPAEWTVMKMRRPMVPLDLSLYGHPVAGNRWDGQMTTCVTSAGYEPAPQWKAIFKEPKTGSALGVYVDDFEMAATLEDTPKLWKRLEDAGIEFKEDYKIWNAEDATQHLGCDYWVKHEKEKDGHVLTQIRGSMEDYHEALVQRFEERMGIKIHPCDTPFLDAGAERRHAQDMKEPGKFGYMAASPLMGGLYAARSCRPDEIVPTLRLARRLTKWSAYHDRKLIR